MDTQKLHMKHTGEDLINQSFLSGKTAARLGLSRAGMALCLFAAWLVIGSCSIIKQRPDPWSMDSRISDEAKMLISKAFTFVAAPVGQDGTGTPAITDYHLHLIAGGSHHESKNAYVNHRLWYPVKKLKTRVLMDASQVFDLEQLDTQYQDRLLDLIRHFRDAQQRYTPAQSVQPALHFYLYAMDYHYDEEGKPVKKYTDLYIPNELLIRVAQSFNRELAQNTDHVLKIIPVASVHPYRKDFKQAIEALAAQGVRFIKWLPPSMNINPEQVSAENYLALARHKMVLLSHTGSEHVVESRPEHETFGDPYKLKKALDCGVNVVALHSGREDEDPATDEPYFDRFMAMMEEKKYIGRLYGEISAMTLGRIVLWEGSHEKLKQVIKAAQPNGALHERMLNGSDYPIPAIALLNPTRRMPEHGMITPDEGRWLDEVFAYNPLLFDFVLKRTIKNTDGAALLKLPESTFFEKDFYQTPFSPLAETCSEAETP